MYIHPSVGMMPVRALHLPHGACRGDGLEAQGIGGRKEPSHLPLFPKPGRSKVHLRQLRFQHGRGVLGFPGVAVTCALAGYTHFHSGLAR